MKSLRSIGYRDAWRVKKNHNLPYSWQVAARQNSNVVLHTNNIFLFLKPGIDDDGAKILGSIHRLFQIWYSIVHGDENFRFEYCPNGLDFGLLQNVVERIDRNHKDIHRAQFFNVPGRERTVISKMSDFDTANRDDLQCIDLSEFLAIGIRVLPFYAFNGDIAHSIIARLSKHRHISRPRKRLTYSVSGIMVIMGMRNQNSIRFEAIWEIVPKPNSAGIRIDYNAFTAGRLNAKTGVSNVLYGNLARF